MTAFAYQEPFADMEGVEHLLELALDLRWSWNHSADELWGQIDPELWSLTHNPWVVLQTVSRKKLAQLCADSAFRQCIEDLVERRRLQFEAPAWFQQAHPDAPLGAVAYFSMEFMLSEALPIYSGGLGNVAGDQLKAASDLGVPVVGVGLLYQQGYFRQVIDAAGEQTRALPVQRSGAAAHHARCATPTASGCAWSIELPGSQSLAARLAGAGRARDALPARQQRPRQQPGRSRHHQRAVRRRPGAAPAAGDRARHRRLAPAATRSACGPRSVTSTRGTPRSPCWSAPAASWRSTAAASRWPWRSRAPATCSPRTRRWPPASIGSRRH